MASQPSQSLVKRPSDTELMPPPPPPKRIKRPAQVLDEDDYTDALSHIVARDFFPGLLESQAQQEYLHALESKDPEWIRGAGRRMAGLMTPGPQSRRSKEAADGRARRGVSFTPRGAEAGRGAATPREWVGDTPMSVSSVSATPASSSATKVEPRSKKAVPEVVGMSLGSFQAKYTSEDNESFNKVLDTQNAKKREKYAWMWSGNKIPTPRQIAYRKREAKRIEGQRQASGAERDKGVDGGGDGDSEAGDSGKQLVVAGEKAADDRPARPDAWKSKPENGLMFIPSSIEDTHETVQQKAESASHAGPKHVVYHNTRIQPQQTSEDKESSNIPPSSPSVSAIRDAIAGRPRPTDSESGFTGGETPRVNGYSFVDEDEPAPQQNQSGEDDEDEQAFHLRLLSSSSEGGSNPFKLQETRKREALHHSMVERVARNKRTEKAVQETKTPVPRFASSPMINFGRTPATSSGVSSGTTKPSLTPAAQRLWANVGTPRRQAGGESSGKGTGLKNMWTPTPKRKK